VNGTVRVACSKPDEDHLTLRALEIIDCAGFDAITALQMHTCTLSTHGHQAISLSVPPGVENASKKPGFFTGFLKT